MKKMLLFSLILCVITVLSCKKSNSSNNNSQSGYYLSTAVTESGSSKLVDSFTYDSSHRLTGFYQTKYDASSGTTTTTGMIFSLAAGSAPATGYTFTSPNGSELHILTFDNQGRVIKDTCSSTGYVASFSYPNGNIAIKVLWNGTPMNNMIDTLFMSGGNIAKANTWMPNNAGTADSLQGSLNFGYSSVSNPFYHSAITGSIGPILYVITVNGLGGSVDPVSVKAQNSISGRIDGLPTNITIPLTQKTDSKGRLSELSASVFGLGSEITLFNYY